MKSNLKRSLCLLWVLITVFVLSPVSVVAEGTASTYPEMMNPIGATIRYTDKMGNTEGVNASGLRFAVVIDKTSSDYKKNIPDGTYDESNNSVRFGVLVAPTDTLPSNGMITKNTEDVLNVEFKTVFAQTDNELHLTFSLLGIPEKDLDRDFTVCPYMKVQKKGEWQYSYSKQSITRNCIEVANEFYADNSENLTLCERLDALFSNNPGYLGKDMKMITFTVFADLHYKQGMYLSSVMDMKEILARADESNSDFIIHLGDFSNDWRGSPELTRAYLQNNYNLPAFGIYGNHELESANNSMSYVTPKLNNRDVVWGTKDGKIGDGSIGYYYYDIDGFRIVCTDTNYSWNPTKNKWEHNYTASYGSPAGNQKEHSFGPEQLIWIENVLTDAAYSGLRCIFFSHASVCPSWSPSPDTAKVQEIFEKANAIQKGTVMMAINGHLHTNHVTMENNVVYLDLNTVRNGAWYQQTEHHYTKQTFQYETYDANGDLTGRRAEKVTMLSQAKNTWFFNDAMSATIKITNTGKITVEGMDTGWVGNVVPSWATTEEGTAPVISSGVWQIDLY